MERIFLQILRGARRSSLHNLAKLGVFVDGCHLGPINNVEPARCVRGAHIVVPA